MPRISVILHKALTPVIFVLGFVMFAVVFTQVVFRYLLVKPLPWAEELARYLMIWIACLAASEAYARGNHVGVNLLVDMTAPKLRQVLKMMIHLAVAVLMFVIAFNGFRLSLLLKDQTSPALGVPMTWPYLAVPVGCALILVQAVAMFTKQVGDRTGRPGTVPPECSTELKE